MSTYIDLLTHENICIYIYIYSYTYIHTYARLCTYVYVHTYMYTHEAAVYSDIHVRAQAPPDQHACGFALITHVRRWWAHIHVFAHSILLTHIPAHTCVYVIADPRVCVYPCRRRSQVRTRKQSRRCKRKSKTSRTSLRDSGCECFVLCAYTMNGTKAVKDLKDELARLRVRMLCFMCTCIYSGFKEIEHLIRELTKPGVRMLWLCLILAHTNKDTPCVAANALFTCNTHMK